jgi:uncharacterized membrane protein YhaH (DUF805 family)
VINFLFGFQGRIRRSQWWLAQLGSSALAGLIFVALAYQFGGQASEPAAKVLAGSAGFGGSIVLAWTQLAVAIKRLHDQGRSGWFYLVGFLPFLGGLILLAMLGFRDSACGDNRFGGSSKYPYTDSAVAVFD